jgi:hypothetical protein
MPGIVPDTGLPVGTVLVYNAQIDQSLWSTLKSGIGTPAGLFQSLTSSLPGDWGLEVSSTDYGAASTIIFGGGTPITITVRMIGPQTYGQPDDVRSIIDGAIGNALGGNYLTSSNISNWTIPQSAGGTGSVVDTGAPAANTGLASEIIGGSGLSAISEAVSNTLGSATKNLGVGTGLVFLILGLAVVAAVLIAVAPTAPARAIAAARRGR